MKKIIFSIMALSVIILVSILTFSFTHSSCDELLTKNVSALADDPIVTETPAKLGKDGKLLLIGDSKKLYQSGKLQVLIDSVLTALNVCGEKLLCGHIPYKHATVLFRKLVMDLYICGFPSDQFNFEGYSHAAELITKSLNLLGISLFDISASWISPRNFNRLLEKTGNKSTLLSETTLSLIKNAIQTLPDCGDVTILCDKHGGRNRYADLLYQFFPDCWIEILTEGTPLSVYRLNALGHKIEFRFQAKADRHIPAALASMTAKLLRELNMVEFNRFWQQYLLDLQPTAGYPVDALRFFGQIDETRQKLGIPKSDIWREK